MESRNSCRKPEHTVSNALNAGIVGAILTVFLSSACQQAPQKPSVSPEQQKRLQVVKSEGANLSLTVLPVRVGGNPWDRLTEFVGLLLEQHGLTNIELGKVAFDPGSQTDMAQMAVSLGEFVKKNSISTGYAIYAEFNGKGGVNELRAIVVDRSGALIWSDRITPRDEAWKKMGGSGDLMVCSTVLVECLAPQLGLNEETAKAAKPGKMAAIMAERSGQPPEDQTAPLAGRQSEMKNAMPQATLVVFPVRVRVAENAPEEGSAADLAKMINDAGLCKAEPANQSLLLKASQDDPNLMKVTWDLAREFRDYVQKNPVDADYTLYADYRFNPQQWQAEFVHFVVCNRKGEWVIADQQNSDNPDYQSVKPTSKDDCDKILVKRLTGYVGQPAEQKVLDRLLGTWSWDATSTRPGSNSEETHATGRYSFNRILGGRFVEGTTLVDAEKNATLLLYTYDEQRK